MIYPENEPMPRTEMIVRLTEEHIAAWKKISDRVEPEEIDAIVDAFIRLKIVAIKASKNEFIYEDLKMTPTDTPDQKAALDALDVIAHYSKLAEPFQDEMQEEFDVALIRIRTALQAAQQVEKVEGLERIKAAWLVFQDQCRDGDGFTEHAFIELEDAIEEAARIQLARQEGK